MKPGYQTSEFWITACVVAGAFTIVGLRVSSGGSVWVDVSAIVVAGLAAIGYSGGRQKLKMEETAASTESATAYADRVYQPAEKKQLKIFDDHL